MKSGETIFAGIDAWKGGGVYKQKWLSPSYSLSKRGYYKCKISFPMFNVSFPMFARYFFKHCYYFEHNTYFLQITLVEDGKHFHSFLLGCPLYKHVRKKYS